MAEKDYTEKKLEDYEEVFADIINVLLFGGRERVLANELEAGMSRSAYKVEGKFEEQEMDAKKYWRSGSVRIALYGLENQTGEDPHFPVRCIAYDGADYRDQIRRRDDFRRKHKNRKPPAFYPVITLVLYFGETRWKGSRSLKDHLKIPEGLERYVSDYRVNVFEVAYLSDEQVKQFKSDFRFVAEYFVQNRKYREGLIDEIHLSEEEVKHAHEVAELLKAITGSKKFFKEESLNTGRSGKEMFTTYLEDVEARAERRGEIRGIRIGEKRGERRGEKRGERRGEIKGAVRIYRTEMGLKPNEIMPKIMSQFNISEKAARKYVKNTIGGKA